MVCRLVYPHSVFEPSPVLILAWSGVGCLDFCMCRVLLHFIVQAVGGEHRQNHDWTLPPPPVRSIAVLHSSGRSPSPRGRGRTDVL